MSVSIAELSNLKSTEPLDLDMYPAAREFRLPPKGRYTVQAPDGFEDSAFKSTAEGNLVAQVDPKIVGGPFDGFVIKFIKVSAKPFENDGKLVSQLGRYLKAAGLTGRIAGDPDSLIAAVRSTANRTYQVDLDWRAYNNSGFTVKGMENFPKLEDGSYQSWVLDPNSKDEDGNPVRVRANLRVNRFVSA